MKFRPLYLRNSELRERFERRKKSHLSKLRNFVNLRGMVKWVKWQNTTQLRETEIEIGEISVPGEIEEDLFHEIPKVLMVSRKVWERWADDTKCRKCHLDFSLSGQIYGNLKNPPSHSPWSGMNAKNVGIPENMSLLPLPSSLDFLQSQARTLGQ